MDYLFPVQHLQAPEKSVGEAADESETEALEVVFFDELVQVHPNERKNKMGCVVFFQLYNTVTFFFFYLQYVLCSLHSTVSSMRIHL